MYFYFFFNVYLFWKRENANGLGAERERDTESEAGSRLRAVSTEPDAGLELRNGEIMTMMARPTEPPRRPRVLKNLNQRFCIWEKAFNQSTLYRCISYCLQSCSKPVSRWPAHWRKAGDRGLLQQLLANAFALCPIGNPPATGTGTLLITLEDVNDNAPFIYPTVAEVCDDAKNLSVVILGASDKDLHPNTDPFKFEIHKQAVPDKVWKISKINSKSSYTFCSCSLAFEAWLP